MSFFLRILSHPLFIQILPQNSPSEQVRSTSCDKAQMQKLELDKVQMQIHYASALS